MNNSKQTECLRGLAGAWDELIGSLTAHASEDAAYQTLVGAASALADPSVSQDDLEFLMVSLRGALTALVQIDTGQMRCVDQAAEETRLEEHVVETLRRLTTGHATPALVSVAS